MERGNKAIEVQRRFGKGFRLLTLASLISTVMIGVAQAQGLQTGILAGVVRDPADLPLPGARITVTSRALQGSRTVVADAIGAYIIRGLPPGTYRARFEFPGTVTVDEDVDVPLGDTPKLDATLKLASVTETVTVTAEEIPPALVETQTSANYRTELISTLPIDRRPAWIAELSPGLTYNTPNVGQVTIAGGFAYDNVFMVDGVDTADSIFGNTNNLFIEDAIEETQVLTSGISAEYGRFSGGVINVITKHGGNAFSGSFRTNLSRPSWSDETPFEKERGTKRSTTLSKYFEGTLGGPIVQDRLWFFNAVRYEKSESPEALREVGTPYNIGVDNKRFEIKLTATPVNNHTFQGSYLNSPTSKATGPASMPPPA